MGTIKYSRLVSIFALAFLMLDVVARAELHRNRHGEVLTSSVGKPRALSSLPKHVVAPDGQLSLFADYDDVDGHLVALYLVNRTQMRIEFSSQDGDIYVKLQALNEAGEWERAQVHRSSWCGNSYYMTPSLRANEYFKFGGYYPQEGERRTVRYRLYRRDAFVLDDDALETVGWFSPKGERLAIQLVSNVGTGRVSLQTIAATRTDAMAGGFGNFATVRDIALGVAQESQRPWRQPSRREAVRALKRFPTREGLALLDTLLADSDRGIPAAAVMAIGMMGLEFEAAEMRFQELLQDKNTELRMAAVMALGERPITPEVLDYVEELLADDELWIRWAAMSVLGGQCKKDPKIREMINRWSRSSDPKIRSVFENMLLPTCIDYSEPGITRPPR